jgi:multiple antibiotic resistance protein
MDVWSTTLGAFLLAFSALISIVNPIGGALIYSEVTANRTHDGRVALARKIGIYSAIVMLAALWAGTAIMGFFGITLAALRIAGGAVVAARAWEILSETGSVENRKQEQAAPATVSDEVAFFPLTIPFTTGPGTIAVAIALSSSRPSNPVSLASFYAGVSFAALSVAAIVALAYAYADTLVNFLGPARSRIMTRLAAFLLLCIGAQIALNGVDDAVGVMVTKYGAIRP